MLEGTFQFVRIRENSSYSQCRVTESPICILRGLPVEFMAILFTVSVFWKCKGSLVVHPNDHMLLILFCCQDPLAVHSNGPVVLSFSEFSMCKCSLVVHPNGLMLLILLCCQDPLAVHSRSY